MADFSERVRQIEWKRLLIAAAIGVALYTLAQLIIFGKNPLYYGSVVAPKLSPMAQNLVGLSTYSFAWICYTIIYVVWFEKVKVWHPLITLSTYSIVIMALSHLFMPGQHDWSVGHMWQVLFRFALFALPLVFIYKRSSGAGSPAPATGG